MEMQPSGLREYLDVVWRRRWWVIATTSLVVGLVVLASFQQTPAYASTVELLVLPVGDTSLDSVTAPLSMENELRIATSSAVQQIAESDAPAISDEDVEVSVENPAETQTLVFEATSSDPRLAQQAAQAYADAYLTFRSDSLLASVEAAADPLQSIIDGLNDEIAAARRRLVQGGTGSGEGVPFEIATLVSQRTDLESKLNDLKVARNVPVGEILEPASLPSEPFKPDHLKAVAAGLVVGLLVGLGLAFLRERLDPRLRGREEVEDATGAALLATIPLRRSLRHGGTIRSNEDHYAAEAFRALRARLLYASSQAPIRSLLVTSATRGEGKSTTATNLALALAEAGKQVILVRADLRAPSRPPSRKRAAMEDDGLGLNDVLTNPALLPQAVERTSIENLSIVRAGAGGASTHRGFSGAPLQAIVEELARSADLVILDTTPVLGVSDALDLAPVVDAVLLVVNVKDATRSEVADAALQLRSVGATVLGVVAQKVTPGRFRGYHHLRYGAPSSNNETADGQRSQIERDADRFPTPP